MKILILLLFPFLLSAQEPTLSNYPTKGPQFWFESHFQVVEVGDKVHMMHSNIDIVTDYCKAEVRWGNEWKIDHEFRNNLDWSPVLDAGIENCWAYHDDEYLFIMELTTRWFYAQELTFPYRRQYHYYAMPEHFVLTITKD